MTTIRAPLALGLLLVVSCGWLLWQGWSAGAGRPIADAPRPAPPVVKRSTWRGRQRSAGQEVASVSAVSLSRLGHSRAAVAPAPAVRGSTPLGAGDDAPADPAVTAREDVLRARVEALRQGHPGVRLVFADCGGKDVGADASGGQGCLARVESSQAADIDRFVAGTRNATQAFSIRVRERPTAMNGVIWQADLAPRFERSEPSP